MVILTLAQLSYICLLEVVSNASGMYNRVTGPLEGNASEV